MKKVTLTILVVITFLTTNAQAEYIGALFVQRVAPSTDNTAMIVLNTIPIGACSYYGYSFMIDLSTKGGQKAYDALTLSLALDKAVDIWYNSATVPDYADHSSGCNPATMATINQVSLKK